jgi:phosphoribosyl 1,2-cyclic phosphodiesterase
LSLYITSLNSGSNGNCYYIANGREAILVDAGLSCRETEKRMARLGLNIQKVKAIFISHEHTDHIKGVEVLSKKHQLPVYITRKTLQSSGLKISAELIRHFSDHKQVDIGKLSVIPFSKRHDAADPYSFLVSGEGVRIGVMTDIGSVCENTVTYFKQCNAAFLEANYDTEMLMTGRYPYHLKKRISEGRGHLSNVQALELFTKHRSSSLNLLLLAHLSKENNDPQLVHDLFTEQAERTKVVVASRYQETPLYHITGDVQKSAQPEVSFQMSMF